MALSKQEVEKILEKEEIVFIATTMPNGAPHLVPIWYIYHQGKIYFETDKTTVKFNNIKHRNEIVLCFGGEDTYIIRGSVSWKTEQETAIPVRKLYWEKYKYKMEDRYINENTYIFEVKIKKELSWHMESA